MTPPPTVLLTRMCTAPCAATTVSRSAWAIKQSTKHAQGEPKSLVQFRSLIGILSQNSGPHRAILANPVELVVLAPVNLTLIEPGSVVSTLDEDSAPGRCQLSVSTAMGC
jgi:hypothetical protein